MAWLLVALVLQGAAPAQVTYGSMRNGSFDSPLLHKPDEPGVVEAQKAGWTLPADLTWPSSWGPNPNTKGGTLEYLRDGGPTGTACVKLDGLAHIASYFGQVEPGRPYVATLHVKGHGKLWYGVYTYSATAFLTGRTLIERDVDTDTWREYAGIFANSDAGVHTVNPAIGASGGLLVDDVELRPADLAEVAMVRERIALYGTGELVEDLGVPAVQADAAFARRLSEYRQALADLRRKPDAVGKPLADAVGKQAAALEPYLAAGGETVVTRAYNDMVALTRAVQHALGAATAAAGTPAAAESPAAHYQPGVRPPRPNALTITDVHSTKVLYVENETATTVATVVNTAAQPFTGTLAAILHVDLDATREVARAAYTIQPGQTGTWSFTYNVGPETYGRGVEVRWLDEAGKLVDAWQEFYGVAAEFFRVQQHTNNVSNAAYQVTPWVSYYNLAHYFGCEPTDFGVSTVAAEQYVSGQPGYTISQANRWAEIDFRRNLGIRHTFYQNCSFGGQAGYEEMRLHPDLVLYDENGQPAVDPIYGGWPNPLELASPLEIGPKRMVTRPYLDRRYTPWQHCAANLALTDAVLYEARRIKALAQEHHFDGIYIDGNMGVLGGYGHDGKPNTATGSDEEYARLNARNHRLFATELRRDDANFGIWYNWSYPGLAWARSVGLTNFIGSGAVGESSDANIRAATAGRNVMLLMETGSFLQSKEGLWSKPGEFLQLLCDQRDFAVQKWGASTIIGYSFFPWKAEEPGPGKWAWPTMGYLGAQLIATQMHHAGGFLPSLRPWLQFQTRYSSLLWSREVKVVPHAETLVQIASREKLWWQRLVYRRATANGYDLIVHLVRIPPTQRWDTEWPTEPQPLGGVKVTLSLPKGKLRQGWALRPYGFEEPQQPVQIALHATVAEGKTAVVVPAFRYGTTVVLRVATPPVPPTGSRGNHPKSTVVDSESGVRAGGLRMVAAVSTAGSGGVEPRTRLRP
ncbi:MAG: hypothetical protein HYU66_07080 [Armatimonadetes bacterium]|nr:hypothetical protein [Armatimonadota bacterium]